MIGRFLLCILTITVFWAGLGTDVYGQGNWHHGDGDEGYISVDEHLLNYTIRFQNTGHDTAHHVVIIDTLSPWLDISSFELGAASHPFDFDILEGNILVWTFLNVDLPEEDMSNHFSHGFVKFHIDHNENYHKLSEVKNHAHVYFEYEEESTTDILDHSRAKHVEMSEVKNKNDLQVKIITYSLLDELKIISADRAEEQLTLEIFDETGQTEFLGKMNNDSLITLDTSFLGSGMHYLSVYDDHHHESLKFFVHK